MIEAIFRKLNPPPAAVPDSTTRRTKLQVWDPSHILELVIKKTFKIHAFEPIAQVKQHVHSISVFFRDAEVYEYLIPAAQALSKRLYSPKALKDLKFVAHGAGLLDDFVNNNAIYEAALCQIIATHTNQDTVAKAQGLVTRMNGSGFMMSVQFLRGLMWVLKKCSLQFQHDQGLLNNYVNTQELLLHVIDSISVVHADPTGGRQPNPIPASTQYVFRDYLDALSSQQYLPPGRGTRNRPTASLASQQQLHGEMLNLNKLHQEFIVEMRKHIRYYWYQNRKWWPESATRLPAAGHLLNKLESELGIVFKNPLAPDHKRCNQCNNLIPDNAKSLSRHSGQCIANGYDVIPALGGNYSVNNQVDLLPLEQLSRDPQQVTDANFLILVEQLKKAKREVDRDPLMRGTQPTLQHYCKKLLVTPRLHVVVSPGMLHLLTVLLTAAASEALCETLGSEMEKYHRERYTGSGSDNTDARQQREMFVRRNAPPIGNNRQFVQKIAERMNLTGVPYIPPKFDAQNNVVMRRFRFATKGYFQAAARDPTAVRSITSVTVNNVIKKIKEKPGRKGALEIFC